MALICDRIELGSADDRYHHCSVGEDVRLDQTSVVAAAQ